MSLGLCLINLIQLHPSQNLYTELNTDDSMYCSDVCVDIAELRNVCWLEIHGKFESSMLSPGILYEFTFVVMLKDPAYGWEVPVKFRLTLPDGSKQEDKQNLMEKMRGQWVEMVVGEFIASEGKNGEIEFSMYEYEGGKWKKGLVVKGVAIRPKA